MVTPKTIADSKVQSHLTRIMPNYCHNFLWVTVFHCIYIYIYTHTKICGFITIKLPFGDGSYSGEELAGLGAME